VKSIRLHRHFQLSFSLISQTLPLHWKKRRKRWSCNLNCGNCPGLTGGIPLDEMEGAEWLSRAQGRGTPNRKKYWNNWKKNEVEMVSDR